MALFVHTTEECERDILRHALTKEVDNFRERRLIKTQNPNLLERYAGTPYRKKQFTRQIRLIAYQHIIDEHIIIVFLKLMVRGSEEYRSFIKDRKGYGDRYFRPYIDPGALKEWLDEQLQRPLPPQRPTPTDDEKKYLWHVLGEHSQGGTPVFVCESEDWVRAVTEKQMQNKLVLLTNSILEASEKGVNDDCIIPVEGRGDIKIIGRFFPQHSRLFLASVMTTDMGDEHAVRERYAPILAGDAGDVTDEAILQHSIRTYPNELLLDEDLWIDVEQDKASNLALSPEEATILESVHLTTSDKNTGFPLFINGRAGSGKSTILQYLFADYLRLYLKTLETSTVLHPLYFTGSPDLLKKSREVVSGLLTCGYRYVLRYDENIRDLDPENRQQALDNCFREFHEFLYSLLVRNKSPDGFRRSGYVDYARFKSLWQGKFGQDPKAVKHYGADLSWHVIRGYIKGLSVDGYIDPEEYSEQPSREKTVNQETFSTIYEKVWNNWYRSLCEDGEYWDDQDLVRKLLDDDAIKPSHPVIFCDEAQDFTRLELEAIFRLSLFSDRRLDPQELNRVPFAFAGDPFQTLNPTGFRWDAIKAAFVLKFVHSLDPTRVSGLTDLNYQELTYNYRSTKNVVRLCNSIQALRSVLFDIPNLNPQTTWQFESSTPMPAWFKKGDGKVLDALKKEKGITIIIPCHEGEEKAFVENDDFLASAVQRDETGVPKNVLSATRAKGQEFPRVVLYGFGDSCSDDLLTPVRGGESYADIPEKALPHEYFVNRLYVAASRPKRRLFVIDTEHGIERLWYFAKDPETMDALLRLLPDSDPWRDNMGMIQPGDLTSWSADREDLAKIAKKYEDEGMAHKDSYWLRSAAMTYENVGDKSKMKQCRAYAKLYERKYKEAGQTFTDCEDYEKALHAYWEGAEYADIIALGRIAPQLLNRLRHRIADFFERRGTVEAGLELLRMVRGRMDSPAFRDKALTSRAWEKAVGNILARLLKADPDILPATWCSVSDCAAGLSSLGFAVPPSTRAILFYRAEDWENAISSWESCGEINTKEFQDAQSRTLIAEIESGRKKELTTEEARLLAEHYTESKRYLKALEYSVKARDEKGIAHICTLAIGAKDDTTALKAVEGVLDLFITNGRWEQLLGLCIDGRWKLVYGAPKKRLRALIRSKSDRVLAVTVSGLSQSEPLCAAHVSQQKRVSDYLKGNLIKDKSWTAHITPDVAGSAIERAGRVVDALQFYEDVMAASTFTNEQKKRARIRWVKNKHRQATLEDGEIKGANARRQVAEARAKARQWGVGNIGKIPEYPHLKGLTTVTSDYTASPHEPEARAEGVTRVDQRLTWMVGELAFRFSGEAGRVNIEHERTMATATVLLDEAACKSGDVKFEETGDSIFYCAEWRMQCELGGVKSGGVLVFRFIDTGVRVEVPVRTSEK